MSMALGIFCALLIWLAAGAGAALLLLPGRGAARVEFAGLTILLGSGFVTMSLFCLGLMGLRGLSLRAAVSVGACVLFGAGILRAKKRGLRFPAGFPVQKELGYALGIVLAAQCLIVSWQTFNHPLGWDGLFVWEIKARIAFLNGGSLPRAFFTDASRAWSHAEYPLGVPLMESWFYGFLDQPYQSVAKTFCPLFYVASVCLFLAAGGKFASEEPWRGAAAAMVMFFIPSVIFHPGGAISGWADFPLAVTYFAAVIYLADFACGGSVTALRIFACCGALLPWIKRDGTVLWACLVAIGAVVGWRRRTLFPVLLANAPGLAVVCGWKVFTTCMHVSASKDFLPAQPTTFFANVDRLSLVAVFLLRESVNCARWSLLWPAVFVALWQLARDSRSQALASTLAASIFLPTACFAGVYCFSAWPDIWLHISTSFPRLLIDVAPVASLAVALALPSPRAWMKSS